MEVKVSLLVILILLLAWARANELCGSEMDYTNECGQASQESTGNFTMDCSGEDYVFSFSPDDDVLDLALFAECSSPCSGNETHLYYNDNLKGISERELNSLRQTLINGSSMLGMPSTLDSVHCRVYGCYMDASFWWHNFATPTCYPVNVMEATTNSSSVAINGDVIAPTLSAESNEVATRNSSSAGSFSSSDDNNLAASTPEQSKSPMTMVMSSTAVGVALVIIVIVLLLALSIFFYKNRLRHFQHHQYTEKMFPTVNSEEEFNFNLSKDSFSPLTQSNSLVSIFHSLRPPSHPLVRPTTLIFSADNSSSLCSSEYFKTVEPNSLSIVEMGLADKEDSSDTSSLSAQSDITEVTTEEVELKNHSDDKNEKSLSALEEFKNGDTKHELILGRAPTSPRKIANHEELHDDAQHSLQMNGNQGNITTGNADGFQGTSFSMERQQAAADSGYIAENNCHQSVQATTQTTEAVAWNAINLSLERGVSKSAVATAIEMPPPSGIDPRPSAAVSLKHLFGHSYGSLSNSSDIAIQPPTQQAEYLPSTSEVGPTDMSSSYNISHGTPSKQEFAALDKVDFRSGYPCGNPDLGPTMNCQFSLPTAYIKDTNKDCISNESIEFAKLRRESSIPLNLSLISLATMENGDTSETLSRGYVSSSCHAISEPTSKQLEDKNCGISTHIFMGLSDTLHQSGKGMNEQDLPLQHDNEASVTLHCEVDAPIPPLELTQENYVQMPVHMADTQSIFSRMSRSSSSADNISIDLQSVVDDFSDEATEDSGEFSPHCSQPKYELCLNYPPDSEAVRKYREGYICSDLTIASENIQFYFPCQKASLCRANNNDQCNESSGFGSSPDSLSENSPDNLNTCHFHFDHTLQTISHEEYSLSNSFCGSNESVSESPATSFSTLDLCPNISSTHPIIQHHNLNINEEFLVTVEN